MNRTKFSGRVKKKSLPVILLVVCLLLIVPFSAAFADDPEDDASALPFEILARDDAIASLPVFKGPFPETEKRNTPWPPTPAVSPLYG